MYSLYIPCCVISFWENYLTPEQRISIKQCISRNKNYEILN